MSEPRIVLYPTAPKKARATLTIIGHGDTDIVINAGSHEMLRVRPGERFHLEAVDKPSGEQGEVAWRWVRG
jgi:hypothetical protein